MPLPPLAGGCAASLSPAPVHLHSKADKPKHPPAARLIGFLASCASSVGRSGGGDATGAGRGGGCDEVLAALAWDPYEHLDLAQRVTALAVAGLVSGLEQEAARMRAESAELRERVPMLNTALQETNARFRPALKDNVGDGCPDPCRGGLRRQSVAEG